MTNDKSFLKQFVICHFRKPIECEAVREYGFAGGSRVLKPLFIAALLIFAFNLPFGYWRSRVQRFSPQWLLAIHLPVPLTIACRIFMGLGWRLVTFPVLIAAFFAGQFIGSKIRLIT